MSGTSLPGYATTDPMKLCPCARSKYLDLVEVCHGQGLKLLLIETMRDIVRQQYYREHGVSKTLRSSHLPQQPFELSLAVDACPKALLEFKNWAPGHPLWLVYTAAARTVGLKCGADWLGQDKGWDWPHVYLDKCQCPPKLPEVLIA